MDVLSQENNSKAIFRISIFFVVCFERKRAKNMFFMIFSKMVIFGKQLISLLYFSQNFLSKNVYICKFHALVKSYDQYKIRQK